MATTEPTTPNPRQLAELDADALAAYLEQAEEEAAAARRRERAAKLRAEAARGQLLERLGDGEAVAAPSGRMVFRDPNVALGRAVVNEQAMLEAMPRLPDYLQPTLKWPGVQAVRDAEARGELPAGVTAADLIAEPERGAGIRWRTVGG